MDITVKTFYVPVELSVFRRSYKKVGSQYESILWTRIRQHIYKVPFDGHFFTEQLNSIINKYVADNLPYTTSVTFNSICDNADIFISAAYSKWHSEIYLKFEA